MQFRERKWSAPEGPALNFAEGPEAGPPLLLLHGFGTRWQTYASLWEELSGSWHLWAPDLRGHGASERTPGHYRVSDYASDVRQFVEQVVGEAPIVLGHSLGGIVGSFLAAHHPRLVLALVVGDSPLSRSTVWDVARRKRALGEMYRDWILEKPVEAIEEELKNLPVSRKSPGVRARDVYGEEFAGFRVRAEDLKLTDPDVITSMIERLDDTVADYEPDWIFENISCPVHIVQADPEKNGLARSHDLEAVLARLRNGKASLLRGVGHSLHLQDKEQFLKAVWPFLREQRR